MLEEEEADMVRSALPLEYTNKVVSYSFFMLLCW
uniref:Uncharacterized protein n=1 Tax=Arundo donax TaxID=35708 RepID=A0A0A9A206_ARUDO